MKSRSSWLEVKSLALPLAVGLGALVLFVLLDGRPPDDHDIFYTDRVLGALPGVSATTGWARVDALVGFFGESTLYPRLATTWLLALLAELGPSLTTYRLANLPFLAALILGCWLLGRAVGDRSTALWAALLAPTMPVIVNESRKWDLQFHAASLLLLGTGLLVWALRIPRLRGAGLGVLAGLILAGSVYCHPIALPFAGLVLLAFVGGRLAFVDEHRLGAAGRGALATGVALVTTAPFSRLPPLGPEPAWSFPNYLAARSMWVPKASDMTQLSMLWSRHADQFLHELGWMLFPSMAVLSVAGLVVLPVALRRSEAGSRAVGLPLWGLAAAGLVVGFCIVARTAYLSDVMCTLVFLGVGLVWALETATVGRAKLLWRGLAVAHLLVVLAVPLVLPATPLAPGTAPWAYGEGVLRSLRSSPSGDLSLTHFVPIRRGLGGRTLARTIEAIDQEEPPRISHVELTWKGEQPETCGPVEGDASWEFGPPEGAVRGSGRQLAWRLAFAGAGRIVWTEPPDELLPEEVFDAAPGDVADPLRDRIAGDPGPDIVVFRLWSEEPATPKQLECSVAGSELLDEAEAFIDDWLEEHEVEAVRDLPAELLGIEDYRTRNAHYLHAAVIASRL